MDFRIEALPEAPFAPLFSLSDADLARRRACRQVVTAHPGFPCRVSLEDARIGETVLLLNHEHLPGQSPYRASHAIYVRQGARQARPAPNTVPEVIRSRLISLRLFDAAHAMTDADVLPGEAVAAALARAFDRADVAYAHLHNAGPGCFAAAARRAG